MKHLPLVSFGRVDVCSLNPALQWFCFRGLYPWPPGHKWTGFTITLEPPSSFFSFLFIWFILRVLLPCVRTTKLLSICLKFEIEMEFESLSYSLYHVFINITLCSALMALYKDVDSYTIYYFSQLTWMLDSWNCFHMSSSHSLYFYWYILKTKILPLMIAIYTKAVMLSMVWLSYTVVDMPIFWGRTGFLIL